jgi:uncharacterized protein
MAFKGAGGTSGGIGQFVIGFIMLCGGLYLLMHAIIVTGPFTFGYGLYHFSAWGGSYSLTNGMILIPLVLGIGIIFYNVKNILGWLLAVGSLAALIFGVISNIHFTLRTMSLFEFLMILILGVGGLGLMLNSLRNHAKKSEAGS